MKPNILRAIVGGFVGTLAMSILMYGLAPMMGVKMDIAGSLAGMLKAPRAVGLAMHVMNGSVIFPLVYAFVFFRLSRGRPVLRGIMWGVALWLMAQLVVMPMIGAGVFSSRMGGMMAVAASLMAHIAYGALQGGIGGNVSVARQVSAASA